MGRIPTSNEENDVKSKLYIDYDSTLNNLDEEWINWANQKYRSRLTTKNIIHWDWMEEEFGKEVNDFWKDSRIYDNDIIKPKSSAISFVDNLLSHFDVSIVTSSWPGTEVSKTKHIRRHFGKINVIHETEKYKVTTDGILIDDRKDTVRNHCLINNLPGIVFTDNDKHSWSIYDGDEHELMSYAKTYGEITKNLIGREYDLYCWAC